MVLIVESGSTKANWVVISDKEEYPIQKSIGLNPFFVDKQTIIQTIHSLNLQSPHITKVYFYGAGCATDEKKAFVKDAFLEVFKDAEVEVHGDLLAAARGVFGNKEGIIGILGTGSNAAYYNGESFPHKSISLGYILGDEGSGNHIGRLLLKAYFQDKLPSAIQKDFEKKYNLDLQFVLESTYKQEFPNRYLASMAKFAVEHQNDPFVRILLMDCFDDFLQYNILKLKDLGLTTKIGIVGSIGFHFQDTIRESAKRNAIEIQTFCKDPLPGLVAYHKKSDLMN